MQKGGCCGAQPRIAPYSDSAILAIVLDGPGYLDACNEANQILAGEDSNRPDSILLGMRIVCACATSACVTLAVWLGIHFMLRYFDAFDLWLPFFSKSQPIYMHLACHSSTHLQCMTLTQPDAFQTL